MTTPRTIIISQSEMGWHVDDGQGKRRDFEFCTMALITAYELLAGYEGLVEFEDMSGRRAESIDLRSADRARKAGAPGG